MKTNDTKKQKEKEPYKYKEFGQRMGDTMRMKGITNRMLANYINLSVSAISGYRTGRRSPSVSELAAISDYLQVSVDYLLGKTNDPSEVLETPSSRKEQSKKRQ